jgi:hypothetical protein
MLLFIITNEITGVLYLLNQIFHNSQFYGTTKYHPHLFKLYIDYDA